MGPNQGEELPRWRIVVLVDMMLVVFANRQWPHNDFRPTGVVHARVDQKLVKRNI